jgi:hypothetical protein
MPFRPLAFFLRLVMLIYCALFFADACRVTIIFYACAAEDATAGFFRLRWLMRDISALIR